MPRHVYFTALYFIVGLFLLGRVNVLTGTPWDFLVFFLVLIGLLAAAAVLAQLTLKHIRHPRFYQAAYAVGILFAGWLLARSLDRILSGILPALASNVISVLCLLAVSTTAIPLSARLDRRG